MDYLQRSFETLKTLNDKKVKELQINQNVQKNKTNIIEQAQAEGEVAPGVSGQPQPQPQQQAQAAPDQQVQL